MNTTENTHLHIWERKTVNREGIRYDRKSVQSTIEIDFCTHADRSGNPDCEEYHMVKLLEWKLGSLV